MIDLTSSAMRFVWRSCPASSIVPVHLYHVFVRFSSANVKFSRTFSFGNSFGPRSIFPSVLRSATVRRTVELSSAVGRSKSGRCPVYIQSTFNLRSVYLRSTFCRRPVYVGFYVRFYVQFDVRLLSGLRSKHDQYTSALPSVYARSTLGVPSVYVRSTSGLRPVFVRPMSGHRSVYDRFYLRSVYVRSTCGLCPVFV